MAQSPPLSWGGDSGGGGITLTPVAEDGTLDVIAYVTSFYYEISFL